MRAVLWVILTVLALALPVHMTLLGAPKQSKVDDAVINAAHFAVTQLNARNDVPGPLAYDSIVSVKKQVVAGTNYHIVLVATSSSGEKSHYEVVVYEKLNHNPASNELPMQLTSYKLVDAPAPEV